MYFKEVKSNNPSNQQIVIEISNGQTRMEINNSTKFKLTSQNLGCQKLSNGPQTSSNLQHQRRIIEVQEIYQKNIEKINFQVIDRINQLEKKINNEAQQHYQRIQNRLQKSLASRIQEQNEQQKHECSFLHEKIQNLSKHVEQLREKVKIYQQENIQKTEKIKEQVFQNIAVLKKSSQLQFEKINEKVAQLSDIAQKEIQKKLIDQKKQRVQIQTLMRQELSTLSNKIIYLNQEHNELPKVIEEIVKKNRKKKIMIDLDNRKLGCFKFEGNRISLAAANLVHDWCQILLDDVIEKDQVYRCQTKFVKAQRKQIVLGLTNRISNRTASSPYGNGSSVCLRYDGTICYGNQIGHAAYTRQEQINFKEGDTIIMEVNLKEGRVKWIKNNEAEAVIFAPCLLKPQIQYAACWSMYDIGDTITWQIL